MSAEEHPVQSSYASQLDLRITQEATTAALQVMGKRLSKLEKEWAAAVVRGPDAPTALEVVRREEGK